MDSFLAYTAATRRTGARSGREGRGTGSLTVLKHLGLGLVGESGEVADKVKKVIRDNGSNLDAGSREGLILETGDVLWHATRIVDHLGETVDKVVGHPRLDSFDEYQRRVLEVVRENSAPGFVGSISELSHLCLLLGSRTGRVAELIAGDVIGSSGFSVGVPVSARALEPVLDAVARISINLGVGLSEVAARNVEKLRDRQKRNTINGSGDSR